LCQIQFSRFWLQRNQSQGFRLQFQDRLDMAVWQRARDPERLGGGGKRFPLERAFDEVDKMVGQMKFM
jgi:hypothetical protein